MKRLKLTVIGLLSMFAFNMTNAQAVNEGDIIFDAYIGFPNLYKIGFKNTNANSGTEMDINVTGIGPLGIRGEYMVADKFGVGLDIGFSNTNINYREENTYTNPNNGNSTTEVYDYKLFTQKLGVMVTFNYHFIQSSDNFDAYVMTGAGYGNRTFGWETNDPNFKEQNFNSPIPVAARIGVGMRYFFNDNIGVNLAIGLGQGGLLNGGISFKL